MTAPTQSILTQGEGWRTIDSAPAAFSARDDKILVIGGPWAKPELVLPDGDWWRMRKREGGIVPTHWLRIPPAPAGDA